MSGARPPSTARRRWLVRVAGSALLLAGLFWFLPLDTVLAALVSIPPGVFASVLLLFLVAHVGAALKWWGLLGRTIPAVVALRAHYAGLAANLCLPGAVGGDAVRAGIAYTALRDGPRVMAVAAADRLIDMAALLAVALFGLAVSEHSGAGAWLALQALVILSGVVACVVALPRLLPMVWRIAPGLPGRTLAEQLGAAFTDLGHRPARLALTLAASATIQSVLVLLSWWLATAAGAEFSWGSGCLPGRWPRSLQCFRSRSTDLACGRQRLRHSSSRSAPTLR